MNSQKQNWYVGEGSIDMWFYILINIANFPSEKVAPIYDFH